MKFCQKTTLNKLQSTSQGSTFNSVREQNVHNKAHMK